ncbi:MAG: hypothetical protein KKH98_07915 [Spirochaetes bacterium]|nr:hypothetical protein [Spirochaetota bacterium]
MRDKKSLSIIVFIIMMLLFTLCELSGFSLNPPKFEIDCESGNKVVLQYELQCTKDTAEYIKVDFKDISGRLDKDQISASGDEITLQPAKPYKFEIRVNTPVEGSGENILKVSFYDVPKENNMIAISSRISTRVYIRYTDKALIDLDVESISFEKKLIKKQYINYLKVRIRNRGNVYFRPVGKLILTDPQNSVSMFSINQFNLPVYSGKIRELITEINSIPEEGIYDAQIRVKTKLSKEKIFKFKIKIIKDQEVLIIERNNEE